MCLLFILVCFFTQQRVEHTQLLNTGISRNVYFFFEKKIAGNNKGYKNHQQQAHAKSLGCKTHLLQLNASFCTWSDTSFTSSDTVTWMLLDMINGGTAQVERETGAPLLQGKCLRGSFHCRVVDFTIVQWAKASATNSVCCLLTYIILNKWRFLGADFHHANIPT